MIRIVLSFVLIVGYSVINAQIINIEGKRLGQTTEGWSGNIDVNFKFTKNTKSVWQVKNKIAIQYKKEKHTHLVIGNLALVRSNTSDLLNFGFVHYRFNRELIAANRLVYEAFTQVQYNSVQKIKLRTLAGTGLRLKIIGNDSVNLNLGVAGMYEYEEVTTPEYNNAIRNSNYLSFNAKIGKQWSFKTILYYQPNITDFSDYRVSNQTSLSHSLTKHISILGTLSLLYDSRPPIDVPVNIFSAGLQIRFKF